MNVLIVYWHPEPQSFNGALFRQAQETLTQAGHTVHVSDLHAMNFNPVSGRHNFSTVRDPDYCKTQLEEIHAANNDGFADDISAEIAKLEWCDLMIWQFPLWWFSVPAMIKGWVDRVFVMGRVYGGSVGIYQNGSQVGKRALLSLTTGGPNTTYAKDGNNGDIDAILRPIQRGMLQFVGFDVLAPNIVYGPARASEAERVEALAAYAARLETIEQEAPIAVGRY